MQISINILGSTRRANNCKEKKKKSRFAYFLLKRRGRESPRQSKRYLLARTQAKHRFIFDNKQYASCDWVNSNFIIIYKLCAQLLIFCRKFVYFHTEFNIKFLQKMITLLISNTYNTQRTILEICFCPISYVGKYVY